MPDRPAIPIKVQRDVLFEARHRCAVCCEPLPLEKAHIRPWSKSKDHSADNLVALCANCHARADQEQWGESYLRRYKQNPCALAAHAMPPMSAEQKAMIDFVIANDPEYMTEKQRKRFVSMAAAYADVNLRDVELVSVSPANSARVRLSVPEHAAKALASGFAKRDSRMKAFFEDFDVVFVELSRQIDAATNRTRGELKMSEGQGISERLEDQISWYDGKSISNQRWHKTLSIVELLAAVGIPISAGADAPSLLLGILGGLIVVIRGLETMNQYQHNWIVYRSTCEALKHEKYLRSACAGPYSDAAKPDALLAERVESLISNEHAKWVVGREKAKTEFSGAMERNGATEGVDD